MSLRATGGYRCDRCDGDVGNAAITECVIVSDLDPDRPGTVRLLHFCRAQRCAQAVLSARNLDALRKVTHG